MKMRTVEITVGGLMIAGILSLLMLALQVSGLSSFFKEDPGYRISADFANIGSLKVRAKVSVAGVVVGRVVKIRLQPETFDATVWMAIDPGQIDKLPIDTRASILTAGLLGDNYISLLPGFNESEFLRAGSHIPIGNTDSALIFEQLISKFLAEQVSTNKTKNTPSNQVNNHENQPGP